MDKPNRLVQTVTRSPFLWGVLGSIGFYAMLYAGPFDLLLLKRYFAGHPVEYMETVLFAVALAALVIKSFDIVSQRSGMGERLLGALPSAPQPVGDCGALLARLDRLPIRRQAEYRVCRLRAALEHVRNRGSADSLDDELKYLSDLDAARLYAGYGLFRVIVWAIPILGFLGTVIGITMALNGVDLKAPDQSMLEVLNGLGLKFDTTALALTLSVILMFIHFYVERAEQSLLEHVDRCAQAELAGRFIAGSAGGDGHIAALMRVGDMMLQATEVLVQRQADLWRSSVDAAGQDWARMAESAGQRVQAAMSVATAELARRAEALERAVAAAGEVARLEGALNRNLSALAGAKHFEQTVLSLAAAVNMLGVRLAEAAEPASSVELEPARSAAQAA